MSRTFPETVRKAIESRAAEFVGASAAKDPAAYYDKTVRPMFEGLDRLFESNTVGEIRVLIANRIAEIGGDLPVLLPFLSSASGATSTEASQIAAHYGSFLSGPDFNVRAAALEEWARVAENPETARNVEIIRAVSILSVGAYGRAQAAAAADGIHRTPPAEVVVAAFEALRDAWIARRDSLRATEDEALVAEHAARIEEARAAEESVSFAELVEDGVAALTNRPVRILLAAAPETFWDVLILAVSPTEIVARMDSGTVLSFPRAAVVVQADEAAWGIYLNAAASAPLPVEVRRSVDGAVYRAHRDRQEQGARAAILQAFPETELAVWTAGEARFPSGTSRAAAALACPGEG